MPDNSISSRFRPLTSEEIDFAEALFGDSMDYTEIAIANGSALGVIVDGNTRAFVPDGQSTIYFSNDAYSDDFSATDTSIFNKGTFVHELTHVFQNQNEIDPGGVERAIALKENGGDPGKLYDYILDPNKGFLDYNVEQQAEIVKDYYFDTELPPLTPEDTATAEDRRDVVPFDIFGGELLGEPAIAPGDDGAQGADGAPTNPGNSSAQPIPQQPDPSPEPALTPTAAPASEPQPTTSPSSPPSQPVPTAQPLTPEDIENDAELAEDQRWLEENGDAQGGDNTSDPDAPPEEDDDEEQEAGGAGNEMPNPMDDGPSYTNADSSVLLTRNAPYVNPGTGDIYTPVGDIDPSVLLNRNAPYINPGSNDFDIVASDSDFSVLRTRNDPYVNPGLDYIDMPVDIDPSVILNRNGPRVSVGLDDAEMLSASSTIGDSSLLDTSLVELDGLGDFELF
jgi:hypothetical protein